MLLALFIVLQRDLGRIPSPRGSHGRCRQELDGLVEAWDQYEALSGRSLRIGIIGLSSAR